MFANLLSLSIIVTVPSTSAPCPNNKTIFDALSITIHREGHSNIGVEIKNDTLLADLQRRLSLLNATFKTLAHVPQGTYWRYPNTLIALKQHRHLLRLNFTRRVSRSAVFKKSVGLFNFTQITFLHLSQLENSDEVLWQFVDERDLQRWSTPLGYSSELWFPHVLARKGTVPRIPLMTIKADWRSPPYHVSKLTTLASDVFETHVLGCLDDKELNLVSLVDTPRAQSVGRFFATKLRLLIALINDPNSNATEWTQDIARTMRTFEDNQITSNHRMFKLYIASNPTNVKQSLFAVYHALRKRGAYDIFGAYDITIDQRMAYGQFSSSTFGFGALNKIIGYRELHMFDKPGVAAADGYDLFPLLDINASSIGLERLTQYYFYQEASHAIANGHHTYRAYGRVCVAGESIGALIGTKLLGDSVGDSFRNVSVADIFDLVQPEPTSEGNATSMSRGDSYNAWLDVVNQLDEGMLSAMYRRNLQMLSYNLTEYWQHVIPTIGAYWNLDFKHLRTLFTRHEPRNIWEERKRNWARALWPQESNATLGVGNNPPWIIVRGPFVDSLPANVRGPFMKWYLSLQSD